MGSDREQHDLRTRLTDDEWDLLESLLPAPKKRGRPRVRSTREILDAVFYVLKSGCQWRMLPRDFPPWKMVFPYFRAWRLDGTRGADEPGDATNVEIEARPGSRAELRHRE